MKKLLIIVALCFNFSAQAATVTLTPSTTDITVGDIFSISVSAQDFTTAVAGASLGLSFDNSLLEFVEAKERLPFEDPIFDTQKNILTILIPGINGVVDGNFDVIEFSLKAIKESQGSTSVNLTDGTPNGWFDNSALRVADITYNPATVNISVSAIPVPGAVWLFSSAIMGIIGLGRRKI